MLWTGLLKVFGHIKNQNNKYWFGLFKAKDGSAEYSVTFRVD